MAKAIVTYARGWQALAITRSLGQHGVEVWCGEEAPFAPCFFSKYCAGNFRYPSFATDPEGFLDKLEEEVIRLKPDDPDEPYVLMPVHKETWLIAEHRDRFEPHIRVPLTTHDNMVRSHDKGKLANLAEFLDIRIPKTLQYKSLDDVYRAIPDIQFPVFLKVREGASGVGVKRCDTPEELTSSFRQFVEGYELSPDEYPLIQSAVDGEDHCVTVLFDKGRCVAIMTYRNVRQFPRETGASALRETVPLPEAEAESIRLLKHLDWHGMAELDYRVEPDGTGHLIEVNPRFFGGLSQAVASNVDYPWLLFQLASGVELETPVIDDTAKTEVPIMGLLATLDEIAQDDAVMGKLKTLRDEASALGRQDVRDLRLRPFWSALKSAAKTSDARAVIREKLAEHEGSINEVVRSDDPLPALGALYPLALMLKHGRLSVGMLTGEDDPIDTTERRSFRGQIRHPRWKTLALTAVLFTLSVFFANWAVTADTLGWALGWSLRLGTKLFHGDIANRASPLGALAFTATHLLNLAFLYGLSALILREGRGEPDPQEP